MGTAKGFQDNCTWKQPVPGSDHGVVLTQVQPAVLPGNANYILAKPWMLHYQERQGH